MVASMSVLALMMREVALEPALEVVLELAQGGERNLQEGLGPSFGDQAHLGRTWPYWLRLR